MKNQKAIVTIAMGERYYSNWKKFCEPTWKQYADKYGFDLICLQDPLDHSQRARARSVAWQKCLILSQDFARNYDRMVWVDSDVMFNACAPDITTGVPLDKVGAVEDPSFSYEGFLKRIYELWGEGEAVINYTPQQYYSNYGLPDDCDKVFNSGVLVLSPSHRCLLEHVYYHYEEKEGGRKWHMEQRPLSYEIVKSGMVHWIDPRFNVLLFIEAYYHYPFLQPPPVDRAPKGLMERVKRKIRRIQGAGNSFLLRGLNAHATNVVFQASFFLHFASMMEQMRLVRQRPNVWWDILTYNA